MTNGESASLCTDDQLAAAFREGEHIKHDGTSN
jgi:hypothetical protein